MVKKNIFASYLTKFWTKLTFPVNNNETSYVQSHLIQRTSHSQHKIFAPDNSGSTFRWHLSHLFLDLFLLLVEQQQEQI